MSGFDWDVGASWDYQRLLLQRPDLSIQGLYKRGYEHFIVVADLEQHDDSEGGNKLVDWFQNRFGTAGGRTTLVSFPPDQAERVPDPTLDSIWQAKGVFRNHDDALCAVGLFLPHDFPRLLKDSRSVAGRTALTFTEELTRSQLVKLAEVLKELGLAPPDVQVGSPEEEEESGNTRLYPELNIVPSRMLHQEASSALVSGVEEDEDWWLTKSKLFLYDRNPAPPQKVLPKAWLNSGTSCLLNLTMFPGINLRNLLPIYESVVVVPPLNDGFERGLASLRVTADELCDLRNVSTILRQWRFAFSVAPLPSKRRAAEAG